MFIESQIVKTKWNSSNKKHYISLGYEFTKIGEEFEVIAIHLPKTSQLKIKLQCDYCEDEFEVMYNNFNKQRKNSIIKKDCCIKCFPLKLEETNLEKYGVKSYTQTKEYRRKSKETNLQKYGVDNPSKNETVKEKIKSTNMKKYGHSWGLQNEEIKNKRKETNLKKYGVEYITQSEEIKEKIKQTNLKKFGHECNLNNPDIRKKAVIKTRKTLFSNGKAPLSIQQRYLHKLLGGELNYPIDRCSLDIAFVNEMIYIEYDGGGHDLSVKLGLDKNKFEIREIKRQKFLESQGWKIIRIISRKDLLPNDETIIELITNAKQHLNKGNYWFEIDIDNNTLNCREYKDDFLFTNLRKIGEV